MDFAAQLANLERQAALAAAAGGSSESNRSRPNHNPPTNHDRRRDRPQNSYTNNGNDDRHNNDDNNNNNGDPSSHEPQRQRRRIDYNDNNHQSRQQYMNHSNNHKSSYNSRNNHNGYRHKNQLPPSGNYPNSVPQPTALLQEMERFGYRIHPPPIWKPKVDRTRPHICLLAITIDDLPYEHIWKAWAKMDTASACYVSLVCHAKFPHRVQSEWLRQRLLVQPPRIGRGTQYDDPVFHTHVPEWGSIHIARAMIDCLRDAARIGTVSSTNGTVGDSRNSHHDTRFDPSRYVISPLHNTDRHDSSTQLETTTTTIPTVDKFIFISESCLPVVTLDEAIQALLPLAPSTFDSDGGVTAASDKVESVSKLHESPGTDRPKPMTVTIDPWDVSWVNARNRNTPGTPKNMYENDQFGRIHRMIPDMYRWKADQWLILSQRHALAILNMDGHLQRPCDQLWNAFAKINASDEMYFPTALGILGFLTDHDDHPQLQTDATNATAAAATTAEDDNVVGKCTTATATTTNKESVRKCAVTYTDWSEGMRNPTSFSNGARDFQRVATLARQQTCVLARKFVLYGPTTPSEMTGLISVEEWSSILQELGRWGGQQQELNNI
jgi:hypothetical protein